MCPHLGDRRGGQLRRPVRGPRGPGQHHGGDGRGPAARRPATFPGFDTATKLKLSGVDVASFGDGFARTERPGDGLRRPRPRRLPEDRHHQRRQDAAGRDLRRRRRPLPALRPLLGRELPAEPGAYLTAAGGGEAPDTELPDDAILCSCNNVAAGTIRDAVNGCGSCDGQDPVQELGGLKACTRAGPSAAPASRCSRSCWKPSWPTTASRSPRRSASTSTSPARNCSTPSAAGS